jgi:multidrug resistance efflux pump
MNFPNPKSVLDNVPDHEQITASSKHKGGQKMLIVFLAVFMIASGAGGFWYWLDQQKYVYTDKASVNAPVINLTPTESGILKRVMARDGSNVAEHQVVAQVGEKMIMSGIAGIVLKANLDIGAVYTPGQPVVTMIDPNELRVVARVEEDKGLKDIRVGQKAEFTVDAYGSQRFQGVVESVSGTSREGDVVFNISDKREEKEFEVKIAYNLENNPFFQNGMSAKVWIIK